MSDRKKEPCPCGSGRTFEACCGKNAAAQARSGSTAAPAAAVAPAKLKAIAIWGGILIIAGVLTTVGLSFQAGQKAGMDKSASATGEKTPEPWEYNPVVNEHWDPRPGHQHWHAGPPPTDPAAAMQETGTRIPEPYEYDPINDRYWDPTHGHWHSGSPPSQ